MGDENEWNEARLLGLIRDKIEESHTWEYKSAGALGRDKREKDGITKAVSGMANASGGTVIFGIAEFADEPRKHLPERINSVDSLAFPKEWLEHVLSEIDPPILGLKIIPVRLGGGGSVYVVEIPQGSTAHQATDYRFYRRRNFEVEPMLNDEVRDVMNRRVHPKIRVSARLIIYPHANRDGEAGRLKFVLENESDVLAQSFFLLVFAPIKINKQPIHYTAPDVIIDETKHGRAYKLTASNRFGSPFFPRSIKEVNFDFKVASDLKIRGTQPLADVYQYAVFADSMSPLRGEFSCLDILEKLETQPWVDASTIQ